MTDQSPCDKLWIDYEPERGIKAALAAETRPWHARQAGSEENVPSAKGAVRARTRRGGSLDAKGLQRRSPRLRRRVILP